MSIVNVQQNAINGISEGFTTCEPPLCIERFKQTGMKFRPKRYCSDRCKMDAFAIRRVNKLLDQISDKEVLAVVRSYSKEGK